MLLYLVRHGETELNAQGVYQGHLPTPLYAAGRNQAERLGEHLRCVPFKQCWSSHLPRAAETAKIVLGPYHPKTPVQLDPLLADRAMGRLEGKPWVADPALDGEAAGVESDEALAARVHTFLSHLVQTYTPLTSPLSSPRSPATPADQGAGCILVVTHEACLLALLQILTDSAAEEYFPAAPGLHDVQAGDEKKNDDNGAPQGRPALTVQTSIGAPISPTGSTRSIKSPTLSCIVDTHIPADIDVGKLCANTALCVVRVWWEEAAGGRDGSYLDRGLVAKGRVESWGDIDHLDD